MREVSSFYSFFLKRGQDLPQSHRLSQSSPLNKFVTPFYIACSNLMDMKVAKEFQLLISFQRIKASLPLHSAISYQYVSLLGINRDQAPGLTVMHSKVSSPRWQKYSTCFKSLLDSVFNCH